MIGTTHHQLPNDTLPIILDSNIDTLGHKVSAIDVFFPHAPFSFYKSGLPLFLRFASLTLNLVLATLFQRTDILIAISANSEEGEVWPTTGSLA